MEYYKRIAYEQEPITKEADEAEYLDKMQKILSAPPCIGVPPEASNLTGVLYLGSSANAENISYLKSKGITHLLNCGGLSSTTLAYRRTKKLYGPETNIHGYIELGAMDDEMYNIRAHFERAHGFIDHARAQGGRILIYCPGVSRSGAIAISYLIKCHTTILEATQHVKDKRRVALCNVGFMKQLISYAAGMGMLDLDLRSVHAPRYGRQIDRQRIMRAHLPMFL